MRTVDLNTIVTQGNPLDKDAKMTIVYKDEFMRLLMTPLDPAAGATFEEMLTVAPIVAKFKHLAADADSIHLEDAEHEELVKRLKNARYSIMTLEIVDMIRDTINANVYSLTDINREA